MTKHKTNTPYDRIREFLLKHDGQLRWETHISPFLRIESWAVGVVVVIVQVFMDADRNITGIEIYTPVSFENDLQITMDALEHAFREQNTKAV